MTHINKAIIGSVLVFTLIGCGSDTTVKTNKEIMVLPTIATINENLGQQKATQAEIDIIKNSVHELSWGYFYKDGRWGISTPLAPYVFSLMPIVNGVAGWGEVSLTAGQIDIDNNNITIGNIPSKTTCDYYDWGLRESKENCIIQSDIENFRNSNIDIAWWFFQASNGNWYIMTEGHSVAYMFDGNETTSDYDWSHTVDIGVNPTFFVEDGVKKMKFESESQVLFELNSPTDESLNFPKIGCSFSDVSVDSEYYPFATVLCQANIDLGDSSSSYHKFEPTRLATWAEILKIANYSKDYNSMLNQCTQSQYINAKTQCNLDFAQTLGFSHGGLDNITIGETAKYLYKLFYNKTVTQSQAIDSLYERGILKTKDNQNITRGDMAKVILSVAGVYRLETEKSATVNTNKLQKTTLLNLPSIPYGLNPPTEETPLVNIELPSISPDDGIKIVDPLVEWANSNCDDPLAQLLSSECNNETTNIYEGFKRKVILPLPSIAQPATIASSENKISADKVVESAKESIGKKEPFVDSTNTHDLLFVNTILGLPTIHKNTQEMVDEYKGNGKTISLSEAKKGDMVVYKSGASSDNLPHVAIISDDAKLKEIGLPNINGIQETTIVPEQVDVVIPIENLNLPTVASNGDNEDIHSGSRGNATYISNSGFISGKITKDDLDMFQIALNENQTIKLNSDSTGSMDIFIDDSHRGNGYLKTFNAVSGKELNAFTAPQTGLYYIGIQNQGNFSESFNYKFTLSCGENGESCPSVGDYDSIDNPTPLENKKTISSKIDYAGDVDYYTFEVLQNTYTGKVQVKGIDGEYMAFGVDDGSDTKYSSTNLNSQWGGYLAKGKYTMQVRWGTNISTGSYTIKLDY